MFVFISFWKLDKQIKENIVNRVYSRQELDIIYSRLKEEVDTKKNGLNRVKAMVLGLPVLFFFLTIMSVFTVGGELDLMSDLLINLFVFLILVGIYSFVRYAAIGKLIRQFNKAIKKGYPELSETLTLS